MKLRMPYLLAAVIWAGVIFLLSSFPDLQTDLPSTIDLILRKGAHVVEYLILAIFVQRALGMRNTLWPTIAIGVLYAASDEWHQTFVAGRTGAIADIGVDAIGVLLGTFIAVRTEKSPWQQG